MKKLNVLFGVGLLLLVGGCSYKYLRTKPTTFINMNGSISKHGTYFCMDPSENLLEINSSLTSSFCDGYITIDTNKITINNANMVNKVNNLLYVSDRNCKRFTDRFYYNHISEESANQFLGLKIFDVSIGVDFKAIGNIPKAQFNEFSKNLKANLANRKNLKVKIQKRANDRNYTKNEMLVDFVEYDGSCSLISFDFNSSI